MQHPSLELMRIVGLRAVKAPPVPQAHHSERKIARTPFNDLTVRKGVLEYDAADDHYGQVAEPEHRSLPGQHVSARSGDFWIRRQSDAYRVYVEVRRV